MFKRLFLFSALLVVACNQPLTRSGLNPKDFETDQTALYTLVNENGMEVCITNYGGRIVSMMVPDKDGNFRDVVLGFDKVQDYFPENNHTDFGAAIGRYANRIQQGRFTLDGVEYQLPQNNFGHCLHGGPTGWQYQVYKVTDSGKDFVSMELVSPDGDNGFPGTVTASVNYYLTDRNSLLITYQATTDKPTIINMTNHAYFNLSGDPAHHSIEDDSLIIYAQAFTPVDSTFMTTGEIRPVEGTPMDFRTLRRIGDSINADDEQIRNGHGFDHNWVLEYYEEEELAPCAVLYCPESGIALTVVTSEPGLQVYCGNFLDGTAIGKKGIAYPFRSAICLETQHYPDSPNKADWPSVVLRPGETYFSSCEYIFSVE